MSEVPNLRDFREFIEEIEHSRDSLLIKMLYLTACRVSELAGNISPSERQRGLNVYGSKLSYDVVTEENHRILVLKIFTAKRHEFKLISLPLEEKFEPWAGELHEFLEVAKSQPFQITRQRIWQIVNNRLSLLDPKIHPHTLRHYRLTHLVENYGFDAYDLTVYAGWTFRTTFGQSGQLDTYLHLDWRKYFPKLLRPLIS